MAHSSNQVKLSSIRPILVSRACNMLMVRYYERLDVCKIWITNPLETMSFLITFRETFVFEAAIVFFFGYLTFID